MIEVVYPLILDKPFYVVLNTRSILPGGLSVMHRLNCFAHYLSKKESSEDALTRAYLVVLRMVPQVHSVFIELIREHRMAAEPELPPFWRMVIGEDQPRIETQIRHIPDEARRLVSILITDERFDRQIGVQPVDREAVYDGVILYPPDWVFIIENKPRHFDVWDEQLNPTVADADKFESYDPEPVQLEWKEIIRDLADLLHKGIVRGGDAEIVRDFLDYVQSEFTFLNPFDSFGICHDDEELLRHRCISIMEEITPGRVEYHRGWAYYMSFEDGPSRQVTLVPAFTEDGKSWKLILWVLPGNTVSQARQLYDNLDVNALLKLRDKGWTIDPNLHFSFMSSHLIWTDWNCTLEEYLDYWQQHYDFIGRMDLDNEKEVLAQLAIWKEANLLIDDDIEKVREKFFRTNRTTMNVSPGLEMSYRWAASNSEKLDQQGKYVDEVKKKFLQALACWNQDLDS